MRGKYDGPKINDYDKFCEYCVVTFAFIALRCGVVFYDDGGDGGDDDNSYCFKVWCSFL